MSKPEFPWSSTNSQRLTEVVNSNLLHVESSTEWSQEDPAVIELKEILQRRMHKELAELPDDTEN